MVSKLEEEDTVEDMARRDDGGCDVRQVEVYLGVQRLPWVSCNERPVGLFGLRTATESRHPTDTRDSVSFAQIEQGQLL
jgi:hypothetical protein